MALTELEQVDRDLTLKGRARSNAEARSDYVMVLSLDEDIDRLLDHRATLTSEESH